MGLVVGSASLSRGRLTRLTTGKTELNPRYDKNLKYSDHIEKDRIGGDLLRNAYVLQLNTDRFFVQQYSTDTELSAAVVEVAGTISS